MESVGLEMYPDGIRTMMLDCSSLLAGTVISLADHSLRADVKWIKGAKTLGTVVSGAYPLFLMLPWLATSVSDTPGLSPMSVMNFLEESELSSFFLSLSDLPVCKRHTFWSVLWYMVRDLTSVAWDCLATPVTGWESLSDLKGGVSKLIEPQN